MKKRSKSDLSVGQEIIAGLEQALAYERGELAGAKVTRATLSSQCAEVAPVPAYGSNRIAALRKTLRLSQPVFATALNVSAETVKSGSRERVHRRALRFVFLNWRRSIRNGSLIA